MYAMQSQRNIGGAVMNEENYSVRWQESHGNPPGYDEIKWKKSENREWWYTEFNGIELEVWKIDTSDNLGMNPTFKWLVFDNKKNEPFGNGLCSTLDKAFETAINETANRIGAI